MDSMTVLLEKSFLGITLESWFTALGILIGAWILDHPKMLKSARSAKLTLDKIDPHALSDTELMRSQLSERLGVEVMNFHITELNYVNDLAQINVYYRN